MVTLQNSPSVEKVYIFAESPVITGTGERVHGPLLEQTARHHVGLDIFEDLSQHLMAWLGAARLDRR